MLCSIEEATTWCPVEVTSLSESGHNDQYTLEGLKRIVLSESNREGEKFYLMMLSFPVRQGCICTERKRTRQFNFINMTGTHEELTKK